MHFSSAITALFALPALSYAAVLPRQNVDCSQYNLLSVGNLVISNEAATNGGLVTVFVRNTQGNQVSWEGIADVKAGTSMMVVNHISRGSGYKNLRVCNQFGKCYFPGGNSETKVWNMMTSGDRWNFALTVRDGSDLEIQALCGVGQKIVDGAATTTTKTTTTQPPTTTTTTTSKTTTTTSNKPTTTTTTKTTSTKTTSTKTTKTSSTISMPPTTTLITYTKATTTDANARTIQTV